MRQLPRKLLASATMLAWLCCCCWPRPSSTITPDERTYLIPTEPQPTHVDEETVRRQRALQTRLSSIVRAKEGKMVNLHSRLPFNLHNRNLSACLDPSSSRSASDSLLASPASPRYPTTYAVHSVSHFHDNKDDYVSRSSSIVTPRREPGDTEEAEGASDREEEDRTPILNLRLVNPKYGIGMGRPLSRGRSLPKPTGPQAQDSEEPEGERQPEEGVQGETQPISRESDEVLSPIETVVAETPPLDADVQIAISPASTYTFKIEETKPLVLAWDS